MWQLQNSDCFVHLECSESLRLSLSHSCSFWSQLYTNLSHLIRLLDFPLFTQRDPAAIAILKLSGLFRLGFRRFLITYIEYSEVKGVLFFFFLNLVHFSFHDIIVRVGWRLVWKFQSPTIQVIEILRLSANRVLLLLTLKFSAPFLTGKKQINIRSISIKSSWNDAGA